MSVAGTDELVASMVSGVELLGAAVLVGGGAVVLGGHARRMLQGGRDEAGYRRLRTELGRVLLVGLEILIVADIVGTIIVEPTVSSVAVLGAIVLIRTVLSLSIDIEIDGRLPWRRDDRL